MAMEFQISWINLLRFRGAGQWGYPKASVPHWLDYNPGVGLAGTFHHVPVSYKWAHSMGGHAQPWHIANVQRVLTAGCNSAGTSPAGGLLVVNATRPTMNQ